MCIPLNCRGLQVLGFPCQDKVYLSVHQLAIELWKSFDTPRVSVQRKINDLGIKTLNTDRNMIRVLRAAGIIDNFRATMILLRDAEILCDGLEHSRQKRGLTKHALQSKHKPGDRSTRREERSANKVSQKMSSIYDMDILQSRSIDSAAFTNQPHNDIHGEWCASSRALATTDFLKIDTLLVADEPFGLGEELSHTITPQYTSLQDWKQPGFTVEPSTIEQLYRKTSNAHLHKNSMYSSFNNESVYKPLSSPNTEMSEFDDMSSPSSRSQPHSNSDTPERFLYLQESSDSEYEEYSSHSDNGEFKGHGDTFPTVELPERASHGNYA